jgi:hypothetical protein
LYLLSHSHYNEMCLPVSNTSVGNGVVLLHVTSRRWSNIVYYIHELTLRFGDVLFMLHLRSFASLVLRSTSWAVCIRKNAPVFFVKPIQRSDSLLVSE